LIARGLFGVGCATSIFFKFGWFANIWVNRRLLRLVYYDLALVVERATHAMSNAITPRRLLRDRCLSPINDWRGRRTGCSYMEGTVKVDQYGIEDLVEFFMEQEDSSLCGPS
jgi:hypothetical protein